MLVPLGRSKEVVARVHNVVDGFSDRFGCLVYAFFNGGSGRSLLLHRFGVGVNHPPPLNKTTFFLAHKLGCRSLPNKNLLFYAMASRVGPFLYRGGPG